MGRRTRKTTNTKNTPCGCVFCVCCGEWHEVAAKHEEHVLRDVFFVFGMRGAGEGGAWWMGWGVLASRRWDGGWVA